MWGSPRARRWAVATAALVSAAVAGAVACTLVLGLSWAEAVDAFVVSNATIGLSFGLCGAVIAWHRPENLVGWLLAADGLGHAITALAVPAAGLLGELGAPLGVQRAVVTVAQWAWPWSIGLLLPLVLLLFPTGRLPSARWRAPAIVLVATAPLFAIELGTEPGPILDGTPTGYLTIASHDDLDPLWLVSELRVLVFLALALAALVVRFRRGTPDERSQLLWLLLATAAVVALVTPWTLVTGTPIVVLFAIPLIPATIAMAIVRRHLLDIPWVLSRALTWLLLTLGALAAYVLLAASLDRMFASWTERSLLATLAVVLLVGPLYPRLQRLVERATYGDRGDPARVMSSVSPHLRAGAGSFSAVAESLRSTLRMPYVGVLDGAGAVLGESGTPIAAVEQIGLSYGERPVGRVLLGLRPGERELSADDARSVSSLTAALAVAAHATKLSEELRHSRQRLLSAVEEERRRLRRELHDDLGPG
ncbi:MAG: sensor histidine kinase, partial [Nocardioidaceae bacterium]